MPSGALTLLILRVLRSGTLHGYAIAQRIHSLSSEVLQMEEGALYPALQKILLKGWATSEWGISETNRKVRFYRLTAAGRKQLDAELSGYHRVHEAMRQSCAPLEGHAMSEFFRRLRYLLNRRRFDRELADDMEFHREMAAREGQANFGNALHLREAGARRLGLDVDRTALPGSRYAARVLRKSPGFTLAAVLMLAIGIGVNVAVFGFFDLMVLRPLNVRDPATLLRFHRRGLSPYAFALPYPEMAFFRENSRTLSAVLAVNSTRLAVEGEEKQLNASFVTANYFRELGGDRNSRQAARSLAG